MPPREIPGSDYMIMKANVFAGYKYTDLITDEDRQFMWHVVTIIDKQEKSYFKV
jgi:hypothetical protein